MKIAIRGEGPTDIGKIDNGTFIKGPMIILLEKLDYFKKMLEFIGFSDDLDINDFIEWKYIHKNEISNSEKIRRKTVLRGKKENRASLEDTSILKGFYKNSEAFGKLAKDENCDIAIFFVDTDKDWCEDRYIQVKEGLKKHFDDETGVPMIPVKISESWLMCYISNYQNCSNHENATSDKESPYYPKNVCENSGQTRHELAENCDPNKINMPSFNKFRDDFKNAVNKYAGYNICD